jgi:hypothetical protein
MSKKETARKSLDVGRKTAYYQFDKRHENFVYFEA